MSSMTEERYLIGQEANDMELSRTIHPVTLTLQTLLVCYVLCPWNFRVLTRTRDYSSVRLGEAFAVYFAWSIEMCVLSLKQ